jgi:hypothetical protein
MIKRLKRRWKSFTATLSLIFTLWQSEIIPIALKYATQTTPTQSTSTTPRNSNAARKLVQNCHPKSLLSGRSVLPVLPDKLSAKAPNSRRHNLAYCNSNPRGDRKFNPRHNKK